MLRENYYSLINGYKILFLERHSDKSEGVEEQYKKNAEFSEIYKLYRTDKKIKKLLLEMILNYESYLKSKSAYYFSKANQSDPHAYLDYNKYQNKNHKRSILKTISAITNIISRDANKNHFKHYLTEYSYLPIWVVINSFTFGNTQYFYSNISEKTQNHIAADFSNQFKKDYKKRIHITPSTIRRVNHILNFFRNVCAHDEVLYNYKVFKFSKDESIFENTFNVGSDKPYKNDGSLFNAIAYLQLVIPKEIFSNFLIEFEDIIKSMIDEITTFSKDEIYKEMGFSTPQFNDGLSLLKKSL